MGKISLNVYGKPADVADFLREVAAGNGSDQLVEHAARRADELIAEKAKRAIRRGRPLTHS